ncbi:MAG: RNA polymerase sigma factor RpoD/SigA [Spirochaetaceae bacterium]|nr:MAG: RNA polymerase sigma factor RpoD/SigA [Spirochaetaceae bacterium]
MKTTRNKAAYQDDTLKAYFDQIKKTPLLSFEQEIELSKRIQKGDITARQQLVEANLRLVVKIAKAYMTNDVGFLDLVQEGNLGLLKAASKYDHRKQVRFSTYASWWIKQSITRALSNKRRQIRLPHRKEDALRKIQKTYTSLSQKLTRPPTVEEVAAELGFPVDEVVQILNISSSVISLDSDLNEESGTFHDVFEDYSYSPDAEVLRNSLREEALGFLERLKEKERQILLYRFSFFGGQKYTLKRISDEMGISPETVRQIEIRALKKLKEHAGELREYVYG